MREAAEYMDPYLEIARLRGAIEVFADPLSWRRDGSCDPNSSNFRGQQIAADALSNGER